MRKTPRSETSSSARMLGALAAFQLLLGAHLACTRADPFPTGDKLAEAFPLSLVWGDFCSKILSVHGPEPGRDYEAEMDPTGSVLGSPLAKLLFGCLRYGQWPIAPLPEELRGTRYSDVETLLVCGNLDFASPAEPVKTELLPYLRKGRLIELSEMGHNDVAGGLQPEAFRRLVETFFLTGEADDSWITYQPMNFTPAQPFMRWLHSLRR